jgi:hypothetical protein
MLFVIGAMAALSIDVVTLYTARSEAQLAADAGALAGARALANSGMTSDTTGVSIPQAEIWAQAVATQVAANNLVGGRNLNSSSAAACTSGFPAGQEICVSFNDTATSFQTDPQVTVRVQRTDLPTFFARIWGSTQIKVAAAATAEAYNPSGVTTAGKSPVAPTCVKPWLVPNIPPNPGAVNNKQIFDPGTGAILDTNLIGYATQGLGIGKRFQPACSPDCSTGLPPASSYHYYPGDPIKTFPPPTQELPTCIPALSSPYQESVAGCIQTPISCNSTANIDLSSNPAQNTDTLNAVNCLTHTQSGKGDRYDNAGGQGPPFQFIAGDDNPVSGAAGHVVMVSDSIVTVPVFDIADGATPGAQVTIIGFLQLFLNPNGNETPPGTAPGSTRSKVINAVGCGTSGTGQAILGNGASPVAVRLISQ